MSTKKVASLGKLKKDFPLIYKELKDTFKNAGKSLKVYELDYFIYNTLNYEYFLSLSSGHAESLATFDMKGEFFEDEISIEIAEFSDNKGSSNEDLYDTDDLIRESPEVDLDNI